MHTLLLLRHAKSDWSISASDHERPLNKRGEKNAPEMAQRLKSHNYKPDKIISSTAMRAKTTAEVFSQVLECELVLNEGLYDTKKNTVIDIIRQTDESINHLMLVGHNPTWEDLAEYLTDESIDMPTCSVVQIRFDSHWSDVGKSTGKIIFYDYPKKKKQ